MIPVALSVRLAAATAIAAEDVVLISPTNDLNGLATVSEYSPDSSSVAPT